MNFGIVQATEDNIQVELNKSDKPVTWDISPDEENEALQYASRMFVKFHGTCRKIPWQMSLLDPKASAGFPYSCDKEEALREYHPYLDWYCREKNLGRPKPIFVANPKTEYLTLDQIYENKIRIFRNPPIDYLLLEKIYFQEQEELLMTDFLGTWSALGFTKEYGGWHEFVKYLMESEKHEGRVRKYFRWDVGRWDKGFGPPHDQVCLKMRLEWYENPLTSWDMENLQWLMEEAGYAFEILPNGEVVLTSITQKSGRLLTSSNNTLAHIFIMCVHYLRMTRKMGREPSYEQMKRIFLLAIYSDDVQGASDFADEYFQEIDLRETYAKFGFEVKEYFCSESPYDIHFLGCSNGRWKNWWVPVYNENRMEFAINYTKGKLSPEERTQRISGLAHNLAFSEKFALIVCELCQYMKSIGQWVGAPDLNIQDLKIAYTPMGTRTEKGVQYREKGISRPECLNWKEETSPGNQLKSVKYSTNSNLKSQNLCQPYNTMSKEIETVIRSQRPRKPRTFRGPRNAPPDVREIIRITAPAPPTKRGVPYRVDPSLMGKKPKKILKKAEKRAGANYYLRSLLLPEMYGGIRYPDGYIRKTAMSKLILEQEVPFFQAGSAVEAPGTYYLIWRPSLVHPLWVYGVFPQTQPPFFLLTQQTTRFGISPLTIGALIPQIQEKQLLMQSNTVYNLKLGKNFQNNDYVEDPYFGTDTNGNNFFGHTLSVSGASASANFNIVTSANTAIGDKLACTVVTSTNVITANITASANGQTSWTGTVAGLIGLFTSDTTNFGPNGLGIGRPGMGFRLQYIPVSGQNVIALSSVIINVVGASATISTIGLQPYDFPDQLQFVEKLTVYRPVSSSAWCAFEGSTLNDGGQHTCLMYRGGDHPNTANIFNYQLISQVDGAYEDKINKGSYQYWVPVSTRDTQMRQPINSSEWTHPYMVIAGLVGTVANNTNPLRIRGIMNMEFCSPAQLWSYGSNRPNQRAIDDADLVLRDMPTSMSNDSHLETIWGWIKGAARNVAGFWEGNQVWIKPLLSAGAMALAA